MCERVAYGLSSCAEWMARDPWIHPCAECQRDFRAALDRLASNLAIAGALCRAFDLGGDWTSLAWLGKYDGWKPGCGKAAPCSRW